MLTQQYKKFKLNSDNDDQNYMFNNSPDTHIVYWAPSEWTLGSGANPQNNNDIIKSFEKNNTKLTIVTGRDPHQVSDGDFHKELFEIATVYYWELYFLAHVIVPFENMRLTRTRELKKLFSCFIRLPHDYRLKTVDQIAKHDLFDHGHVSLICPVVDKNDYAEVLFNHNFEYWDNPRQLHFSSEPDIVTRQNLKTLPDEYWEGCIDLICESADDVIFYTEKTLKAILSAKPFLLVSGKNANMRLRDYGFELYDELFDYSFDMYPDINDRIAGAVDQINQYRDANLVELYESVQQKAIRNLKHLYTWSLNNNAGNSNIPDEILELFTTHKDEGVVQMQRYFREIGYFDKDNNWTFK